MPRLDKRSGLPLSASDTGHQQPPAGLRGLQSSLEPSRVSTQTPTWGLLDPQQAHQLPQIKYVSQPLRWCPSHTARSLPRPHKHTLPPSGGEAAARAAMELPPRTGHGLGCTCAQAERPEVPPTSPQHAESPVALQTPHRRGLVPVDNLECSRESRADCPNRSLQQYPQRGDNPGTASQQQISSPGVDIPTTI